MSLRVFWCVKPALRALSGVARRRPDLDAEQDDAVVSGESALALAVATQVQEAGQ